MAWNRPWSNAPAPSSRSAERRVERHAHGAQPVQPMDGMLAELLRREREGVEVTRAVVVGEPDLRPALPHRQQVGPALYLDRATVLGGRRRSGA